MPLFLLLGGNTSFQIVQLGQPNPDKDLTSLQKRANETPIKILVGIEILIVLANLAFEMVFAQVSNYHLEFFFNRFIYRKFCFYACFVFSLPRFAKLRRFASVH